MEPRETAATAFRGLALAYKQTLRATAIISQAVTPFHGALDIISSIPGAAPLRGLPRAMCCRPVNTGLLNSAHLRFAVQLDKLFFCEFLEIPN